jgi:hypothetical protein
MSKIVFGRHLRGAVMHVADVSSGLACRCLCLDCGERLIAKKGELREHHFAHASGKEHEWTWETHLHAYAKQLIVEEGALAVPLHAEISELLRLPADTPRVRLHAGEIPIRAEVSLGSVRPDLLLHLADRDVKIAFEVMVTHACDVAKVAEFKRQQVPVLEIDLRKFPYTNFNRSLLRNAVLDEVEGKTWLWPSRPPVRALALDAHLPPWHVEVPEPAVERRGPPESPARSGLPPALPGETVLQFHVPAWKAAVKVEMKPQGAGVKVSVRGMQGGISAGQPEMATPRVVQLVEEVFATHVPWAKRMDPHTWFVEGWDTTLIAEELSRAAQSFRQRQLEERRRQEALLSEDLREARERSFRFRPSPPPAAALPRDPRENPYARRKG